MDSDLSELEKIEELIRFIKGLKIDKRATQCFKSSFENNKNLALIHINRLVDLKKGDSVFSEI